MSGRFSGDEASLSKSLAWHSGVTAELQRRILEAREYVRSHSGDRHLLAILNGHEPLTAIAPAPAPAPTETLDFGESS